MVTGTPGLLGRVPMSSRVSLAAAEDAARAIFRVDLRPLQRVAVAAALQGASFLFVSPTASGKSVCFQLPAAVQPAGQTTLVVSPLLALMQEQTVGLRRRGIDAVELHSGSSRSTSIEKLADATTPPQLIYTTPEWLVRHHMRLSQDAGIQVSRLVVDEAHCLSEWGAASGFRSDYLHLGEVRDSLASSAGLRSLPVSCFTATAPEQVRRDIIRHLNLPPLSNRSLPTLSSILKSDLELEIGKEINCPSTTLLIEANPDRSNLELHVRPVPSSVTVIGGGDESARMLIEELGREILFAHRPTADNQGRPPLAPRTIIFCATRADAERISVGLTRLFSLWTAAASGSSAGDGGYQRSDSTPTIAMYHSGLSGAARRNAARQWARGRVRVLVATPAVGLGLDSPDVELILHPTLPPSLSSYWQQVGRGGRDGRKARCVLWYSEHDVKRVRHCLQAANPGLDAMPRGQAELTAMDAFCNTAGCRREILFRCTWRTRLALA